ncbi:chromate transporter [Paracoccus jeotgali]|uniref:chromate transporter n=1 Tax=Paracoccus jeotgali TaxID=2065379 RepID=UPI0028B21C1B|nr:chromate transporter [Paracoccus jeotgali]
MRPEPNGILGAALALPALILPDFLLLIVALPLWDGFRPKPQAQSAMQGANAAVVGILGAALYSPVFTSAIGNLRALTLALACSWP